MAFTLSFPRPRRHPTPTRRRPRLSRLRDCIPGITITINRPAAHNPDQQLVSQKPTIDVSDAKPSPPHTPCACANASEAPKTACTTSSAPSSANQTAPVVAAPTTDSPTVSTTRAPNASPAAAEATVDPPVVKPTPVVSSAIPSAQPVLQSAVQTSTGVDSPHENPGQDSRATKAAPKTAAQAPSLSLSIGPDIYLTLDLPSPAAAAAMKSAAANQPASTAAAAGATVPQQHQPHLSAGHPMTARGHTASSASSVSGTQATMDNPSETDSETRTHNMHNMRGQHSVYLGHNSHNGVHAHPGHGHASGASSSHQPMDHTGTAGIHASAHAQPHAFSTTGHNSIGNLNSGSNPNVSHNNSNNNSQHGIPLHPPHMHANSAGGGAGFGPTDMHCPNSEEHERLCRIDHSLAFTSRMASYDAAVRKSVQLYDFNSNLLLLVTLNDGDKNGESPGSHSAADASREGSISATESIGPDSEVEDTESGVSESEIEPSEVSCEDSHDMLLKQLENGDSCPNEVIEMALHRCQAQVLTPEAHNLLMYTLESGLDAIEESSDAGALHPDVRVEAHHTLSKFFAEKGIAYREKALSHCQHGLLMLHSREKHSPRTAAELHILSASLLVATRDPSKMGDIFSHIRAARVALFACVPLEVPEIQFQIYVTLGDAYSVCMSNPACENLLLGYDAYMAAVEMVRMGAIDADSTWMHLTCLAAQLALRFLRHKRTAQADPKSSCAMAESPACRRDASLSPQIRQVCVNDVLKIAEDVRQKLARMLEFEETDYSLQQRLSVAHEVVARCYVERSYIAEESRVRDLNRAIVLLSKAMRSCEWSDEYAGQRYSSLVELLDESRRRLREAEAEAVAKGADMDDDVEGEPMWVDGLLLFDEDGVRQRTGSSGGKKEVGQELVEVDKEKEEGGSFADKVVECVPAGPMAGGGDASL